jgi:hypothetical protein
MDAKRFFYITILLLLFGFVGQSAAQDATTCPALVEQAVSEMGDNCEGLERNSACYGHNSVLSTFTETLAGDFFSRPADRAPLVSLETIQTTPLDLALQQWGIAVLNVQANLPNTLPGQGVIVLLLGDVSLENDVSPEEALQTGGVSATTMLAATLHSIPDLRSPILVALDAGADLVADGVSVEGDWLRVVYDDIPAWVNRNVFSADTALDSLPVVDGGQQTPMQAFHFNTGIGQPACQEAEPVLAVQGPDQLTIDLSINGVNINIGSLVTFQNQSEDSFTLTVHEGEITLPDGTVVAVGQTIDVLLDAEGNVSGWSEPRPATPEELARGERVELAMTIFGGGAADANPLPCPGDGGPLTHIVAAGESLFGIALRYDTSAPQILQTNNIANPNLIFAGQSLLIPNPCSGFVGPPPPPPVPAPVPVVETDPCAGFVPTSPTSEMPYGPVAFFWDPTGVPGLAWYRVTIRNESGDILGPFRTNGTETRLDLDAASFGGGDIFTWFAEAVDGNGQTLCTSPSATVRRREAPPPPPPVPTLTASWFCSGVSFEVIVTWDNAMSGDTINISFTDSMLFSYSATGRGVSGQRNISLFGPYTLNDATVKSSSGQKVKLKGGFIC